MSSLAKDFSRKSKRGEDEIMLDVIEQFILHPGIKQTTVMYKANLSHPQLTVYFRRMIELGLLVGNSSGKKHSYCATREAIALYIRRKTEKMLVAMRGESGKAECDKCGKEANILVSFMSWANCCPHCLMEFETNKTIT